MCIDIQITSRMIMLSELILGRMTERCIVSINGSPADVRKMDAMSLNRCKNIILLEFADVESIEELQPSEILPSREHIERVLKFADNNEPLTVHCHGGISRSSACAYLIGCMRLKDPNKAIKLLDETVHYPNGLILKLGAEILGNNDILKVAEDWKSRSLDKMIAAGVFA